MQAARLAPGQDADQSPGVDIATAAAATPRGVPPAGLLPTSRTLTPITNARARLSERRLADEPPSFEPSATAHLHRRLGTAEQGNRPWCRDACLAMRLPDPGGPEETLKPMDQSRAWFAPLLGDTAQPAADTRIKRAM